MLPRAAEAEVGGVAHEVWTAPSCIEIIREAVISVEPKDLADASTDCFLHLDLISVSRFDERPLVFDADMIPLRSLVPRPVRFDDRDDLDQTLGGGGKLSL